MSRKKYDQVEYTISLQMTILTWFVEFSTVIFVIVYAFNYNESELLYRITFIIDLFLYVVIIPSCYLIKTEKIKSKIYSQGWYKFILQFFPHPKVRVAPEHGIEMNAQLNHRHFFNPDLKNRINPYHIPSSPNSKLACDGNDENWIMRIDLHLFDE